MPISRTTKGNPNKRKGKKKRILVIENDEILVQLIKEVLEGEGFAVEIARDGAEGLERIKRNRYDVIISDCEMPRMKGSKLYLEVKKLSPDLAKRIIFVPGTITDFIKSTGNRFLRKPFSLQQLVELVKELIPSDT